MGIGTVKILKTEVEQKESLNVVSKAFPAMLKRCRAYLKLTQKEYAEKIGVSLSAVRAWEQGKQLPNFENYDSIIAIVKDSPLALEIERIFLEQKGQ